MKYKTYTGCPQNYIPTFRMYSSFFFSDLEVNIINIILSIYLPVTCRGWFIISQMRLSLQAEFSLVVSLFVDN